MAFLKTILIILLVYFGLKFLIKMLSPFILRYFQKKMGQKFQDVFNNMNGQEQQTQKEGSITIDKVPNNKSSEKSKVGEYVDYEEID